VRDHLNKLLVKGSLVLPAHLADLATVAPNALPLRIAVHSNGGDNPTERTPCTASEAGPAIRFIYAT